MDAAHESGSDQRGIRVTKRVTIWSISIPHGKKNRRIRHWSVCASTLLAIYGCRRAAVGADFPFDNFVVFSKAERVIDRFLRFKLFYTDNNYDYERLCKIQIFMDTNEGMRSEEWFVLLTKFYIVYSGCSIIQLRMILRRNCDGTRKIW